MSTRSAKPQRQSQHATRRAERPSQKPGKENADPKVSNAVTSSRPSKVKRIVDSFSTDERDNKDAPDSDLVARVARVGFHVLPVSINELKGGLRRLKSSGVVLDGKIEQPATEPEELNELAGLGIAGTTPGGRRWRARLKPVEKPASMASLS